MGEYLSANLYTEERAASAGPVAAVSTSTYATAGWLQKGKVNVAQLVASFDQFVRLYGSYWRNSFVPYMMAAFFQNNGARAYVTRVVPADATKAANATGLDSVALPAVFYSRKLADPVVTLDTTHYKLKLGGTTFDATGDLGVGGSYALSALAATIGAAISAIGTCTVEATVGGGSRLKFTSTLTGVAAVLAFSAPVDKDASKVLLGLDMATAFSVYGEAAIDWKLDAMWQGLEYNKHSMLISGNDDDQDGHGGFNSFTIENQEESSLGAGDWSTNESYDGVVFDDETSDQFAPTVVNGQTDFVKITEGANFGTPRALKGYHRTRECVGEGDGTGSYNGILCSPAVEEGQLTITAGSIVATDQGDGTLSGAGVTSGTINNATGAWSLVFASPVSLGTLIVADYYTAPSATSIRTQLGGGTDGTGPITRNLISDPVLEATKAGIYSLNDVDENVQLSLPDFAGDVTISNDLIAYADSTRKRFILLTTPLGTDVLGAKKFVQKTAQYNTKYAALYYPWVTIADPLTTDNRPLNVPPDGFIAGVYARTDINRNVGKAPAGITDGRLIGAIGLERILSKGERDVLYPVRINPLVSSPQTGRAVWGARTLSKDAEWLYVNHTRLFMFCEASIEGASWWVVFENNGPGTWSRMTAQGNGFFLNIFRDGYLAGNAPADAFKIVINETNNPQEAIDAGLLTADYYIAPNTPGEFVRLRFQKLVKKAA